MEGFGGLTARSASPAALEGRRTALATGLGYCKEDGTSCEFVWADRRLVCQWRQRRRLRNPTPALGLLLTTDLPAPHCL